MHNFPRGLNKCNCPVANTSRTTDSNQVSLISLIFLLLRIFCYRESDLNFQMKLVLKSLFIGLISGYVRFRSALGPCCYFEHRDGGGLGYKAVTT